MSFAEELSRKIYITRKSRILAAERLEKMDLRTQALLVWYSGIITSLSVWIFFLEKSGQVKDSNASLILLVASIIFTIYSTFIASKGYREKSIKMQSNYIAMTGLFNDLHRSLIDIDASNDPCSTSLSDKAAEIDKQYLTFLATVDNHAQYDYLKAIIHDEIEKKKMTRGMIAEYYICLTWDCISWPIYFIGPVVLIMYYIWR